MSDGMPRKPATPREVRAMRRAGRIRKPKVDPISPHVAATLAALGYDLKAEHFAATPGRVARFLREWSTQGKEPPRLTTFPSSGYSQIIAVGGIRFHAMCAHHGLPFIGTGAIGYLPRERIVGLSKLARVLDHFSRRYTVQEDVTRDVAEYLSNQLRPHGLGVVLRAEHLCMSMRGIERPGHFTITSEMTGTFLTSLAARDELLRLVEVR